jgi:hypothetical protein
VKLEPHVLDQLMFLCGKITIFVGALVELFFGVFGFALHKWLSWVDRIGSVQRPRSFPNRRLFPFGERSRSLESALRRLQSSGVIDSVKNKIARHAGQHP